MPSPRPGSFPLPVLTRRPVATVRPADTVTKFSPPSPVDAIRAAVRPYAPRGAADDGASKPDVESVREAIKGGSTRRTVIRTGVWSVPVVAAAVAAPAFAASPGQVCTECNGAAPVRCTIQVTVPPIPPLPPGACVCGTGLVCATLGPLNLANVCVGTGLVATQCGPTTCTGICVAAGGALIAAVNVLVATLTVPLAALNVLGCSAGITGFIPGNICVVPVTNVNAGNFGALCITNTGTGLIGGTATTAVNVLKATVNALGIGGLVFANACASPYSCKPGVRASARSTGGLGCALGQSLDLNVGLCQC